MINVDYPTKQLAEMITYVCYDNLLLSERVTLVLLRKLQLLAQETFQQINEMICHMLTIEDAHQLQRIQWILGNPCYLFKTTS